MAPGARVRRLITVPFPTPSLFGLGQAGFTDLGFNREGAVTECILDPRRLTVALSRAKRKIILVASRSVFSLFSADEETFAHAQLWKNLLRHTATVKLWEGPRAGHTIVVWGNETSNPVPHPLTRQRPP